MLSDREIIFQQYTGNIRIEPFEERLLNANSYDVRLGPYYYRQQKPLLPVQLLEPIIYNSDDGQERMWEAEYREADNGLIVIMPQETILAHTMEFIGGMNIISSEMRAKSTTGRYTLSVCKCAGLGDVGFTSRWTMEISNHGWWPVAVRVGEPVAQIIFHNVGPIDKAYGERAPRYGVGEWNPKDMLPKKKTLPSS